MVNLNATVHLMSMISRPIYLSNDSHPLIAGMEMSIFEAIKHT